MICTVRFENKFGRQFQTLAMTVDQARAEKERILSLGFKNVRISYDT